MLLLLLDIDAFEAMSIISTTHQTSVDIAPYYITYNLKKAKIILTEDIEQLDELLEIFENYICDQFNPHYSITNEISKIKYLDMIKKHLSHLSELNGIIIK